jgi:hypothetical protein
VELRPRIGRTHEATAAKAKQSASRNTERTPARRSPAALGTPNSECIERSMDIEVAMIARKLVSSVELDERQVIRQVP